MVQVPDPRALFLHALQSAAATGASSGEGKGFAGAGAGTPREAPPPRVGAPTVDLPQPVGMRCAVGGCEFNLRGRKPKVGPCRSCNRLVCEKCLEAWAALPGPHPCLTCKAASQPPFKAAGCQTAKGVLVTLVALNPPAPKDMYACDAVRVLISTMGAFVGCLRRTSVRSSAIQHPAHLPFRPPYYPPPLTIVVFHKGRLPCQDCKKMEEDEVQPAKWSCTHSGRCDKRVLCDDHATLHRARKHAVKVRRLWGIIPPASYPHMSTAL
jgi:hypothetical protein